MPAAPTCIQPSDVAGQLAQLQQNRSRPTAIIFLSGPSATQVPIETLRQHDVICVNGSIDYLLLNDVKPFIYLVTDHNFFLKRKRSGGGRIRTYVAYAPGLQPGPFNHSGTPPQMCMSVGSGTYRNTTTPCHARVYKKLAVGIEPTTTRLQGGSSTAELR